MELQLFHWEPNGIWLKPLVALHEKGLSFRSGYMDLLAFATWPPVPSERETVLDLDGTGPVLVHGGRQITESFFLIEYLEDAFPHPPLRPADALGHARILAWGRFLNEVLSPAVNTLGCHSYLAQELRKREQAEIERFVASVRMKHVQDAWRVAAQDAYPAELLSDSRRKVELAVRRIETALADSPWLVGPAFSLADIDAFAFCNCLTRLTPDLVNDSASPRLLDWVHRIRDRPAVQAALAASRTGTPELAFVPGPEHSRWG